MTRSWSPGTAEDTQPWPPEVPPYGPPNRPYPPYRLPSEPSPAPNLPTWVEPVPEREESAILDRLLDQRVILATGHLDTAMAERVSAQLLLLDRTDHSRPIELHLSCRESELEASLTLAAAVDLTRAQVRAVVIATLAGPGLAVLCAAHERAAHRHATFVLSLPRASVQGPATTLATQAEEHERMVTQLVERLATASGRPEQQVEEELRSGRVLSAQQAKDYGLVSSVV